MATRSSTTYRKRQKEMARQEKQRVKAEKRAQRKLEKRDHPGAGAEIDYEAAADASDSDLTPEEAETEEESE